jgi:predicted ribosomally synthesized peptide with SipW-like signal peptide
MKKTKLIALTMIVALMLTGAGYAAWTDYTQVDASIATGILDVDVTQALITRKPEYANAEISNSDKEIEVNISNLYPTKHNEDIDRLSDKSYVGVSFTVTNNGSIPVKLDNVEFTKANPTSPAWDHLKMRGAFFGENKPEITLQPGQIYTEKAKFWINEDAPNDIQNENIGFTLRLNWKQANM